MANIHNYGNLHWCLVFFDEPDNKGESKKRPVFVVDNEERDVYFFRVTTNEGKEHQKKYRPPLFNWRKYGLDKPSYINIESPLLIRDISKFTEATHIAKASKTDIKILEQYIRELQN